MFFSSVGCFYSAVIEHKAQGKKASAEVHVNLQEPAYENLCYSLFSLHLNLHSFWGIKQNKELQCSNRELKHIQSTLPKKVEKEKNSMFS